MLKRRRPRPRLNQFDRLFWIILRCVWSRWAEVLVAVKPETVVGWHRAGFRLFWKWQSRAPAGRPKTTAEIRALIRQLAEEVSRIVGGSAKVTYRPLPQDDPTQRKPDITRAREWLGWEPTIALAEGLAQTVEFFRGRATRDPRASRGFRELAGARDLAGA